MFAHFGFVVYLLILCWSWTVTIVEMTTTNSPELHQTEMKAEAYRIMWNVLVSSVKSRVSHERFQSSSPLGPFEARLCGVARLISCFHMTFRVDLQSTESTVLLLFCHSRNPEKYQLCRTVYVAIECSRAWTVRQYVENVRTTGRAQRSIRYLSFLTTPPQCLFSPK
jgi:hypothetical protein